MRFAIIGNSGSGKSTLAQELASLHRLASLDLDTIAWEPGKVAEPREPAAACSDVARFCNSNQRWVIEGCYASLMKIALLHAPALLFIDPGREACLANCRDRPWEPHKYKSKQAQDEKLEFLLRWVREYYRRHDDQSLSAHQDLFQGYPGPKRKLTRRVERNEMEDLKSLCLNAGH
jgi:adenylate kinase family enzyme